MVEAAHMLERRSTRTRDRWYQVALRAGVNSIEHASILVDEAIQLLVKTGADLVAVRGDPLSDITVLETVNVVILNDRLVVDHRNTSRP